MRKIVTVTEAKTQLLSPLERVRGSEKVASRRGRRPVAKLVRYDEPGARRQMGELRGQIWMSDDFDDPDEAIERLFGTRD